MGSLMAGWDSPKSGKFERNRSLTKEEIEAYWKIKKKTEEEHLKAIPTGSLQLAQEVESEVKLVRSASVPPESEKKKQSFTTEEEVFGTKKTGWWTRSNWAFLNEPPEAERPSSKYVSQFHVANLKAGRDSGISA